MLRQVQSIPGVRDAALSTALPAFPTHQTPALFEGQPAVPMGRRPIVNLQQLSPDYARTLGIPLLAGRVFNDGDTPTSNKVVVVNKSFAGKFFGTPEQGLGRTFKVGKTDQPLTIVGVVTDAKHSSVRSEFLPIFYTPIFQDTEPNSVAVYIRTQAAPENAASAARVAVAQIDSRLVVDTLQTLNTGIDITLTSERLLSFLASSFGIVAAFITAIGLYGVLAYSMAQRTREIGIRLALGATRSAAVWLVLRDALVMVAAGIAIALPCVWALGRLVESQLYDVKPTDPIMIATATLILCSAALGAALIPARRASAVNPTEALRFE